MTTRQKILETARRFIGCNEKDGTHKPIIDEYNKIRPLPRGYKMTYTDPWCASFVSAVAYLAGGLDIIPAECSCSRMIEGFKALNEWEEKDSYRPAPGDVVFYDWQDTGTGDNVGTADHVGIVESVTGDTMTVIEGNFSDSVKRRTIAVNGRYIRGYGLPRYTAESPADGQETPPTTPPAGQTIPMTKEVENAVDIIARAVIRGGWGNGATRKDNLYKVIQGRVNEILSGE